jgi:hypothetical protein
MNRRVVRRTGVSPWLSEDQRGVLCSVLKTVSTVDCLDTYLPPWRQEVCGAAVGQQRRGGAGRARAALRRSVPPLRVWLWRRCAAHGARPCRREGRSPLRAREERRRLAVSTAAPRRRRAPRHRFSQRAWTDVLVPSSLQAVCSAWPDKMAADAPIGGFDFDLCKRNAFLEAQAGGGGLVRPGPVCTREAGACMRVRAPRNPVVLVKPEQAPF